MSPREDQAISPQDTSLDLDTLTVSERQELERHGFRAEALIDRYRKSRQGLTQNRVSGSVSPPNPANLLRLPEPGSAEYERLKAIGVAALERGECALAVLAGGMATRMGGVVKGLVTAVEGKTFLELRLAEQDALAKTYGKRPPLWLMTSQPTHEPIVKALGARLGQELEVFQQNLSVRLDEKGGLFRDKAGQVSFYSPGHGDFPEALSRSGLLERFRKAGGRYLLVSNLDNLGGGLDPVVIGLHLSGDAAITCEVVEKRAADRGGVPVDYEGRTVILEEFRLPESFDPTTIPVFNVNTLAFSVDALLKQDIPWTYFEVTKQVEGQKVLQYERLIHELTFHLPTRYAVVPREGARSRFLPVKDMAELEARQQEIKLLAQDRGMLAP
jgi:UTP--glucose-1-phosphate uridylyltransferase